MAGVKNFDIEKTLRFDEQFWKELSIYIKKWIKEDMRNGECQLYTGNVGYKSRSYMKYKANYMKRFTNRVSSNIAGSSKGFRRVDITAKNIKYFQKNKPAIGQNLKAYAGRSIKSNWTASVNMMLTGDTIEGLEYEAFTPKSLTMRYKDKDAYKIIGNEQLGRFITTLNEKNQARVIKKLEQQLDKNIRKFYQGKIKLEVGRRV